MLKIKRALFSVSDKTGIVDFAKELSRFEIEIISTGGTAKLLKENNITVKEVSEYTGFPEMLDGRVKTLHPKIHAGLLALRNKPEHMQSLEEHNIGLLDMVVVNLYPFEETIKKPGVSIEEIIENIDIGGPSMLRSAAKNYKSVAVVSSPLRYAGIMEELNKNQGALPEGLLRELGIETFKATSHYDGVIYGYLKDYFFPESKINLPETVSLNFTKLQDLRYGENPHQRAAFYRQTGKSNSLVGIKQVQGKELSFNNILDLNSAFELIKEFANPAAVIVKHNNPCGAAEDKTLNKAFFYAWKTDPLSAFGGIVALNRKLDLKTAGIIAKSGFLECIIAPAFDKEALGLFSDKKNLRLLESADFNLAVEFDFKRINGGALIQDKDTITLNINDLKVVTKKKPSKKELESLIFAWKTAKHVKSNAIILSRGLKTVGIGAGQMSRVDSVFIAKKKAGALIKNSCLASDAFFPKSDAVILAAKAGVKAIIQPGGSIVDAEIIKTCDKYGLAMVFTGIRHFKH